jgi:hypothetical protein
MSLQSRSGVAGPERSSAQGVPRAARTRRSVRAASRSGIAPSQPTATPASASARPVSIVLADPDAPVTRAELDAVHERLWRLEDYAKRLAGLMGAAGGVLDAAKIVEQEVLHPKPKEITT